jgi:hypothetical protein
MESIIRAVRRWKIPAAALLIYLLKPAACHALGFAQTDKPDWQPLLTYCTGKNNIGYIADPNPGLGQFGSAQSQYIGFARSLLVGSRHVLPYRELETPRGGQARESYADMLTTVWLTDEGLKIGEPCDLAPELDARHDVFVAATSRRMVYIYRTGTEWTYQTIDHKNTQPGTPSLVIHGGTLKLEGRDHIRGTFENKGYIYQVDLGMWASHPGASVTVFQKGRQLLKEEALFYKVDQEFVDQVLPPAPFFIQMVLALKDGRVLALGSNQGHNATDSAIYDSTSGQWGPSARLVHPRSHFMLQQLANGSVVVLGGIEVNIWNREDLGDPKKNLRKTCEIWDLHSTTWKEGPTLTRSMRGWGMHSLADGRILQFEDMDWKSHGGDSLLSIYDPDRNQWSDLGMTPIPIGDTTEGLLDDGRVYVLTGHAEKPDRYGIPTIIPPYQLLILDPKTGRWTRTAKLPFGGKAECGPLENTALVCIGATYHPNVGATFYDAAVYDLKSDAWRSVTAPSELPHEGGITVPQFKLVRSKGRVAAFVNPDNTRWTISLFDPARNAWQRVTQSTLNGILEPIQLPDGDFTIFGFSPEAVRQRPPDMRERAERLMF